jgi:hypothetical protein
MALASVTMLGGAHLDPLAAHPQDQRNIVKSGSSPSLSDGAPSVISAGDHPPECLGQRAA